jgi:hypothetical protein
MPQDYKGYTIPSYTDTADAPRAFQDLVDDIEVNSPLPPQSGQANRALTTDGSNLRFGVRTFTSASEPSALDGIDGDIWIQYV